LFYVPPASEFLLRQVPRGVWKQEPKVCGALCVCLSIMLFLLAATTSFAFCAAAE
jgi:hypothetical protein